MVMKKLTLKETLLVVCLSLPVIFFLLITEKPEASIFEIAGWIIFLETIVILGFNLMPKKKKAETSQK